MIGFAHVIMLNDSVEHVVAEPSDTPANLSVAVEKMHALALAYFARNRWSFNDCMYPAEVIPYSPQWTTYLHRCHWHVRTVEMS